jgi:hypothetical protein
MKIDCVLSATNSKYSHCALHFVKFWKKLFPEIDVKIIFVGKAIPNKLNSIRDKCILLDTNNPIISNLRTAYLAQNVRLYYPALLPHSGSVLISDIDMFPMNRSYYTEPIRDIPNDAFVTYRNSYSMCYNTASPKTWSEVFGIKSINDTLNALKANHPPAYSGTRGSHGWFQDQWILGEKCGMIKKARGHYFNIEKNFKRLECGSVRDDDLSLIKSIRELNFSDLHLNCLDMKDADFIYSMLPEPTTINNPFDS